MFNFDFVEAWRALHTKCSFVNWELKSEYKGKTNLHPYFYKKKDDYVIK